MESPPLVITLSLDKLPPTLGPADSVSGDAFPKASKGSRNLSINTIFGLRSPTKILSWGCEDDYAIGGPRSTPGYEGAILGYDDGSLHIFRTLRVAFRASSLEDEQIPPISIVDALDSRLSSQSQQPSPCELLPPPIATKGSAPEMRSRTVSIASSRSGGNIHAQLSYGSGSRAQATAVLSNEQVSAPRNYVDFDPETARLKEILKTKGVTRETGLVDNLIPYFRRKSVEVDKEKEWRLINETLKYKKKEQRLSSLSLKNLGSEEKWSRRASLQHTPQPSATPASPRSPPEPESHGSELQEGAIKLKLIAHFLPERMGRIHRIVALEELKGCSACLSLQESGTISLVNFMDGRCLSSQDLGVSLGFSPPASPMNTLGINKPVPLTALWKWKHMFISQIGLTPIVLLTAVDESPTFATPSGRSENNAKSQTTRCTVLKILPKSEWAYSEENKIMKVIGDWAIDCYVECVGLVKENEDNAPPTLYHLRFVSDPEAEGEAQEVPHLIASKLSLRPPQLSSHPLPTALVSPAAVPTPTPAPVHNTQLLPTSTSSRTPSRTSTPQPQPQHASLTQSLAVSVPNAFIGLRKKLEGAVSSKNYVETSAGKGGDIEVLMESDLGLLDFGMEMESAKQSREPNFRKVLEELNGMHIVGNAWTGQVWCVAWKEDAVKVFNRVGSEWQNRCLISSDLVEDIRVLDQVGFAVIAETSIEKYTFTNRIDSNTGKQEIIRLSSSTSLSVKTRAIEVSGGNEILTAEISKYGHLSVERHVLESELPTPRSKICTQLWIDPSSESNDWESADSYRRITAVLPLGLKQMILGFASGHLASYSFADVVSGPGSKVQDPPQKYSQNLQGKILHLSLSRVLRTGQKIVVAGGDDGSIAIYDLMSLDMLMCWTIFVSPLVKVVLLEDDSVGRLKGSMFAISEDGTIATISPDGLELLHVIPGSSAQLRRICLGEDNLLLLYKDGRARLWDMKTLEFWRSMDAVRAGELLAEGGWFEVEMDQSSGARSPICSVSNDCQRGSGMGMISLDIRLLESQLKPPNDWRQLKVLLSYILSHGHIGDVNELQQNFINCESSTYHNISCSYSINWLTMLSGREEAWWCISSTVTADRLLCITSLLRFAQNFPEMERNAEHLIVFYTSALQETFGEQYCSPSLSRLLMYWHHPTPEIRQSARSLFEAAMAIAKDEEVIVLVDDWRHQLPCLQPDINKISSQAAHALLITGCIAVEKYSLLAPAVLTDISKSIVLYLHDEESPHRVIAVDLCAKGFHIWQNYVDAMEILRSLFTLATSARPIASSARLAVLQIASGSTPLFITTLTLDILHPRSVEQQKSIMQLVAFLIRRRPLVLYPSLPRLAEAVVKSLDPNSDTGRDVILEAATEILSQIVKTYPSIDFHKGSQRLAVGTSEGAMIMYDLKSATRLYVLEGHRKRLTACSFSPDGRRLATVSLEESVALVWKVGSSFTSFFKPGAPPRQGHGSSEPYKTFPFSVGDEGNMTIASTLDHVKFEWPADRNARLIIRDSILTFNA